MYGFSATITCIIFNSAYFLQMKECQNYHRLVLSKEKKFNFLVRIDMKNANLRRSLIVQKIHTMEDDAPKIEYTKIKIGPA